MIDKFRTLSQGIIAKILLSILILSFVVWGIGDIFRGQSDFIVAKIGNEKITTTDFDREILKAKSYMREDFTLEKVKAIGIDDAILKNLTNKNLMINAAHTLGINLSEDKLLETIQKSPYFQDKNGKFSKMKLINLLNANRISEAEFIRMQKKQNDALVLNDILSSIAEPSDDLIELLYKIENEKIDFQVIKMPKSLIKTKYTPNKDEIQTYYENNMNDFLTPERRSISYLEIERPDLANPTSDKKDKTEKDKIEKDKAKKDNVKKDKLKSKEKDNKINVDEFALEDKFQRSLDNIEDKIAAGIDLKEIGKILGIKIQKLNNIDAQGNSKDKNKSKADFAKDAKILRNIFELPENEISSPIEHNKKYYVIKLDKITEKHAKDLAKVKGKIKSKIIYKNKVKQLSKLAKKEYDKLLKNKKYVTSIIKNNRVTIHGESITRNSSSFDKESLKNQKIPNGLVEDLFAAKKDLPIMPYKLKPSEDFIIAIMRKRSLVDKINKKDKKTQEKLEKIKNRVKNEIQSELLTLYTAYLHGEYDVQINKELVEERIKEYAD